MFNSRHTITSYLSPCPSSITSSQTHNLHPHSSTTMWKRPPLHLHHQPISSSSPSKASLLTCSHRHKHRLVSSRRFSLWSSTHKGESHQLRKKQAGRQSSTCIMARKQKKAYRWALAADRFSSWHCVEVGAFFASSKNPNGIVRATQMMALRAVTDNSADARIDEAGEDVAVDFEGQSQLEQSDGRTNIVRGRIGSYASRALAVGESLPPEGFIVLLSCAVGLMTGAGVVLFNIGVHEIHDVVWHGIPSSGASWLRKQPLQGHWLQLISVPAGGGVVVGMLNFLRSRLEGSLETNDLQDFSKNSKSKNKITLLSEIKAIVSPVLKTVAAAVTLGTGNSLGPEGPSVEIGASIANGLGTVLKNSRERKLSLVAAGSAAGISSGFNAAVSGCFFAVESVLRPSSADSAPSLTTAMVILSSVLASVVSQAGLGSDPAFKIPAYDFRSPAELPLYLLLGILCGLVSVALTKCSSYSVSAFDTMKKVTGVPAALLPPLGGLFVGVIALAYPEVLYWGFENVDVLLESRLFVKGPPAELLLQLVGAKLVATSICRGSGLVGGVYAPSLFMGAALGSAYGKLAGYAVTHADPLYHLDALKVAAPQAYALVGMAAMLAGVCQVPLTSVLLLFELTRDYRIILPLMGAVGLSSWIASAFMWKKQQAYKPSGLVYVEMQLGGPVKSIESLPQSVLSAEGIIAASYGPESNGSTQIAEENDLDYGKSNTQDICQLDNSLCVSIQDFNEEQLMDEIPVAAAMRTRFAAVACSTEVREALELMLVEKEWCVLVLSDDNALEGIVTLSDIQQRAEKAKVKGLHEVETMQMSAICSSWANRDQDYPVVTVYPDMTLKRAQRLMARRGLRQLPVVSREIYARDQALIVVGLLDREGIRLACRAEATRRMLGISCSCVVSDGASVQG